MIKAFSVGGLGSLDWLPFFRRSYHHQNQLAKLFLNVRHVTRLVSVSVAGEDQQAIFVDTVSKAGEKSLSDRRSQGWGFPYVPAQRDF